MEFWYALDGESGGMPILQYLDRQLDVCAPSIPILWAQGSLVKKNVPNVDLQYGDTKIKL
jgi:hypothetical protein